MRDGRDVLLIGYGNPGRGDDGLGPAFAQRVAALNLLGVDVEIDYQLTVEHALMISSAMSVVFADAAIDADAPFYFRPLGAASDSSLGSHHLTPGAALSLSRLLFGTMPMGFVLGLRGSRFGDMSEEISETGLRSLEAAQSFFLAWHEGNKSSG